MFIVMTGIYQIQSKCKPERIYIGSAVSIKSRKNCHLWELAKQRHKNKKLQRHYNKYGRNDLEFTVLTGCNKEELIKTEQFFIGITLFAIVILIFLSYPSIPNLKE